MAREGEAPAEPTPVPLAKGEGEAPAEPTPAPVSKGEGQAPAAPTPAPPAKGEGEAPAEPPTPPPDHDPYADEQPEPPTAPAKAITLGDIQRDWQKILAHLHKVMKKTSEEALARAGEPVDLRGSLLTIGFPAKFNFHATQTEQNAGKIAQAIQEVTGARLKVNAIVMGEQRVEEPSDAAAGPSDQPQAPDHPRTNEVLTMFGGKEEPAGDDPWGKEQT